MLLAIESSPKVDAYDVVVIGAGIGGLSAAAVLAKQGQRVLVLEQGNAAGGYAHAFQHGPYTLDPAVHVFSQGHDHALPAALLSWLGVREQVRMIPFAQNYSAVYPDMMVNAPFGFDAYVETHQHSLDGAFYTAQSVLSALGAPEIGLEHPDLPPSA